MRRKTDHMIEERFGEVELTGLERAKRTLDQEIDRVAGGVGPDRVDFSGNRLDIRAIAGAELFKKRVKTLVGLVGKRRT